MNCRQARYEMALLAGDDLADEDRRRDVERHLSMCPGCRRQHQRLCGVLGAVSASDVPATYVSAHSLWPSVRRRMNAPARPGGQGVDWKSWTPFAAGVAACAGVLMMASVALQTPGPQAPVSRQLSPLYPPLQPIVEPLMSEPDVTRPTSFRRSALAEDR
ncbi:MAG: zf-HC2 domain-containing protein [Planctomyces sp.]|nr:zf-HC2 domain-containing protein [Planctomyces sp.]